MTKWGTLYYNSNIIIFISWWIKVKKARIWYRFRKGGHYYEVVFNRKSLQIFTLLSLALVHSKGIEISEDPPPPYDIVAIVKIVGGRRCYVGSYSNYIQSEDYGPFESSFTIVDYKIENHSWGGFCLSVIWNLSSPNI